MSAEGRRLGEGPRAGGALPLRNREVGVATPGEGWSTERKGAKTWGRTAPRSLLHQTRRAGDGHHRDGQRRTAERLPRSSLRVLIPLGPEKAEADSSEPGP